MNKYITDYNTAIGFDYDGTLSCHENMQLLAQYQQSRGNKVYIITKRNENEKDLEHGSKPVLDMASELGIPIEHVHFTSGGPKSPLINELGIIRFYDDQMENKLEIEENSNCKVMII